MIITVTNVSQDPVLIHQRYLGPGASVQVDERLVDCDDKRLLCVRPDGGEDKPTVARETPKPKSRRRTSSAKSDSADEAEE